MYKKQNWNYISENIRTRLSGIVLRIIGHVRYINIRAWLRGFRVKIANFSSFFCPSISTRDLDTKKTTPNEEVSPESLGAMLEYWYIDRGLLLLGQDNWLTRLKFLHVYNKFN